MSVGENYHRGVLELISGDQPSGKGKQCGWWAGGGGRGEGAKRSDEDPCPVSVGKSFCSMVLARNLGKYTMKSLLFCSIDEEML